MRSRRWIIVTVLALALGSTAWAQSESRHVFRGHLFYSNPTGETRGFEADDAFGFDLGWEFRYGERLGFNLDIAFSQHDVGPRSEEIEPTPVTSTVLFHLTPDSRFDLYVGPGLAVVFYDDIDGLDVDTDLAIALRAGVDIPLRTEGLSLSFDVRYIGTTADIAGFDFDIDPIIFSAGVAYRF